MRATSVLLVSLLTEQTILCDAGALCETAQPFDCLKICLAGSGLLMLNNMLFLMVIIIMFGEQTRTCCWLY